MATGIADAQHAARYVEVGRGQGEAAGQARINGWETVTIQDIGQLRPVKIVM